MHRRSTAQDDYLLRLIRQAADAIRRLRERISGATEEPAAVRQDVAAAITGLLGEHAALVQLMDAGTAVRLVGDAGRVARWCDLLEVDADAAAVGGHHADAEGRRARAAALRAAAVAEWGELEP